MSFESPRVHWTINSRCRWAFGLAAALLIAGPARANLSFLAQYVPDSANAIALIDVAKVLKSLVAREGGWAEEHRQMHDAGATAIPPKATSFVTAAHIDFELMQTPWEVSLAQVRQLPSARRIAEITGGRLDRIGSFQAVERPNDTFVVRLGSATVGAMAPANRQRVLRWLRERGEPDGSQLSPLLQQAVLTATGGDYAAVIALDAEGVFAPDEMAAALKDTDGMEPHHEAAADPMAGFRGVELRLVFEDAVRGELRMVFAGDAAKLTPVAKPVLLSVLAKQGAQIDEFSEWEASAEGNAVVLKGELSGAGLRRVLSVVSGPASPLSLEGDSADGGDDPDAAIAEASREYFRTVTGYLDDLVARDEQLGSLNQVAFWVSRYADTISSLDASGVDDMTAGYGMEVVQRLGEMVDVVNRAQNRTDLRDATIGLERFGRRRYARYGAWGYYEKPYATRDRAVAQADETLKAADQTRAIAYELRDLTTATREALNKRYGGGF
ncbi:MAG: hypothetical protein AAGA92_12680 [Planctomycetota bacterium]